MISYSLKNTMCNLSYGINEGKVSITVSLSFLIMEKNTIADWIF